MLRSLTVAVLVFIALALAVPAFAGPQCAPHDQVATALREQFGEVAQLQGLSSDGRLMEIWANPETGTWTATMTSPDGMTCLRAAGDNFQTAKPGDPA